MSIYVWYSIGQILFYVWYSNAQFNATLLIKKPKQSNNNKQNINNKCNNYFCRCYLNNTCRKIATPISLHQKQQQQSNQMKSEILIEDQSFEKRLRSYLVGLEQFQGLPLFFAF